MKRSYKIAAAVAAALGLGLAAAAFAHPGAMGAGMGPGMGGGMGPAMMHGGAAAPMAGQQLMTPEEHSALQEKMRNAKTPEERENLAQSTREEMHKRAQEKGITLPQHGGNAAGAGADSGMHAH